MKAFLEISKFNVADIITTSVTECTVHCTSKTPDDGED